MIAVFDTLARQELLDFGVYKFKLDDILEKGFKRKDYHEFLGWVIGLYLDDFLIYEKDGIKNMVQINRIQNYWYYYESIPIISIERYEEIKETSFTDGYYSTYTNHNHN